MSCPTLNTGIQRSPVVSDNLSATNRLTTKKIKPLAAIRNAETIRRFDADFIVPAHNLP